MDGLLEQSRLESSSSSSGACIELIDLRREPLQLRDEVESLRLEVAALRLEILELRRLAGYWKRMHTGTLERIAVLEQENEHLQGENRRLKDQQFGKKSEKKYRTNRSNDLDGLDGTPPEPSPQDGSPTEQKKKQQGPKRRDFSHLQTQEQVMELPKDEQVCPTCSLPLVAMTDTEDSEQVVIDVKAYRRVIRRRRYRKTCTCPGCLTTTAPTPAKLIPKSLFDTSVWVDVLVAKYFNHQPIERLLASWALIGLNLAPSTVNEGLERLQPLFVPVYEAIAQRNRLSPYQQADETRWLVFVEKEGKQGYRWWLWVFNGEDTVAFVLDHRRSHDVPEGHFTAGISIVLMVDRLASYKAMEPVKTGLIVLAFCWAHVRRDFIAVGKSFPELVAWALEWLKLIRQAYRCNRERRQHLDSPNSPEYLGADAKLRQVMDQMKAKAVEQLGDNKLRQPCRKVLESLQEHWIGLTRFVDDPRIPMDNNVSEGRLRGPAVGRKNYYGSFAEWSGKLAMMLFSVFATLRMWKINPRTWLRLFLDACAAAGGKAPGDIQRFLPWQMSEEQRKIMEQPLNSESVESPDSS